MSVAYTFVNTVEVNINGISDLRITCPRGFGLDSVSN